MPKHYGTTTTTMPRKQAAQKQAKGAAKRGNAVERKLGRESRKK